MTKKLGDLIRQTTESEGVGDIALIDPEAGYFAFSDYASDGDSVFYVIDDGLGNKEGGWGVFHAGTTDSISRASGSDLKFSTNGGAAVNFNSGVKTVICAISAKDILLLTGTFATNNVPLYDGTGFAPKTRAQVAKRVTVDLVATTNVNLASGLVAGGTLDGVTLSLTGADDGGPHKVLLTGQSTASQNGVYPVVASGASSRDTDFNTAAKLPPMLKLAVRKGTAGAGTEYLFTTAPGFTLDTTSLTFSKSNSVHAREIASWAGADNDFVQQKSGALTNRTPTQVAADIQSLFTTITSSGLFTLNGGQIKFPATQSASSDANTLDDYEEGTWTPALNRSTSYATQHGLYIKIGSLVIAWFNIVTSATVTSGALAVQGLPFTSLTDASFAGGSGLSQWYGLTLDTGYTSVGVTPGSNATIALLYESGSGKAGAGVNGSMCANPATFTGIIIYQAAA